MTSRQSVISNDIGGVKTHVLVQAAGAGSHKPNLIAVPVESLREVREFGRSNCASSARREPIGSARANRAAMRRPAR